MEFSRPRGRGTPTPQRLVVSKPRGAPVVRAMVSYGQQLEIQRERKENSARRHSPGDWLTESETALRNDVETTQREVELIRTTYEDISNWLSARAREGPHPGREQANKHRALMASCREYSSSRLSILLERLRQVEFWASSRDIGRRIPNQSVIAEWHTVDANWRRWLSEQAVARQQGQSQWPAETVGQTPWVLLGPLPYILDAYIWLQEGR